MPPIRTCRACLIVCLVVGIGFVMLGVLVVPAQPHFQLDVVLTTEELRDRDLRDKTLDMLERASGNQWLFWVIGGLAVCVSSGLGLWSLSRLP